MDLTLDIRDLWEVLPGDDADERAPLRIAQVVARGLPHADGASLARVGDAGVHTVACTNETVGRFDEAQYEVGSGPCLHAIETRSSVVVDDLLNDPRWSELGQRVESLGVRSVLGDVLLTPEGVTGSINIYSLKPKAFTDDDRLRVKTLAAHAAALLTSLDAANGHHDRVAQLEEALQSRDVIGQAKGILMEREVCSADQAFEMLKVASQRLNRKLREVAAEIVDDVERRSTS